MRSRQFVLGALLSTLAVLTAGPAFAEVFSPVQFTGFNRDILWGPDGIQGGYAQDAGSGVGGWCTYAQGTTGFNDNAQTIETRHDGLPAGSSFTSLSNSDHTYALAAAGGDTPNNNALWLTSSGPTGTLILTSPAIYSAIGIVSASPDNGATWTVTLNYSDSTSSTSATYSNPDWFQGSAPTNAAYKGGISSYGYAGTLNVCHFVDYGVNLYLVEQVVTTDPAKTLTGITFTQTGGTGNIDIMAVSGALVPEPSTIVLFISGLVGLVAYAWRKRQ